MATVDINDVATVMSQLQTNYTNLALSWYDVFYNTVAQDISLDLYDINGVLTTYTIPNRAKDFMYIKNGNNSPESSIVGTVGSTYQDLTNGDLYIKSSGTGNTGWSKIAKIADIQADLFTKGEGSPEGVIVATIGNVYINTLTGDLYIKTSGSGNTGWYLNAGVETKSSIQTKLGVTSDNITAVSNLSGINTGDETSTTIAAALGYTPANNSLVVHTSSDETIGGIKSFTGLSNMTSINIGTLGYVAANPLITAQGSVNTYNQIILRNSNTGATASSDIVVNNNMSTDTTFYGDFGMNSSGWVGSGALNTANNVYLTATSTDLAIGTTTSNAIHFVVAGGSTDAMTISSAGAVTIPNIPSGIVKSTSGALSNATAGTDYLDSIVGGNLYCVAGSISKSISVAGTYVAVTTGMSNSVATGFSYTSGTASLTCSSAGVYQVKYSISAYCATAAQVLMGGVMSSGTIIAGSQNVAYAATASQPITLSGSFFVTLTTSNYLQLAVSNATATNAVVLTYANLTATKISN